MTDQDQIKAIAELEFPDCEILFNGLYDQIEAWKGKTFITVIPLNRYNSRDAIVPVIEKQSDAVIDKIKEEFCFQTPHDYKLFPTPQQLCEALLRATGRWKE